MATKKKKSSTRSPRAPRMVYYFGSTKVDGRADQRSLLGGKGANLADMTSIGLPVPPGMTITTDTCATYYDLGGKMPSELIFPGFPPVFFRAGAGPPRERRSRACYNRIFQVQGEQWAREF